MKTFARFTLALAVFAAVLVTAELAFGIDPDFGEYMTSVLAAGLGNAIITHGRKQP
jgi:hypothetical protein